jgi:type I restriction enzyme S subunit
VSLTLKPYAEYKESGLPWLGKIPAHWSVRRAKQIFSPIDIRSKDGNEELLTVSSKDSVLPRSQKKVTMFKAESYVGYKLCWPGDLVINSLWAWARGLGFSRYHGIVSSAYGVYRPKPRFAPAFPYFDFLLRSDLYNWELHVRSKGIWISRLQLTDESFFDMPILVPPVDEAEKIAAYVKVQDLQIRKLIRVKRRMIELLNEQKQAIIQRAVTRGLDPNVRLKPSGVDMVGEIPEHWQTQRVRTFAHSIDQGVSPQAEAGLAENGSWGVLKAGCANGGVFREREHKKLPERFVFDSSIAIREGDILVSRACGSPKLVGSVALVTELHYKLILSDKTFRPNLHDHRLARFIVAAMNTPYFRVQVERAISGAEGLANNLPLSSLKDLRIVLPPVEEALAIADHLQIQSIELDKSISAASREIDFLREYRTRLIADVVTGKLDVRGVELPELNDVEEVSDVEDDELESFEELVAVEESTDAD